MISRSGQIDVGNISKEPFLCVSPYSGWAPSFRVRITDWLEYCGITRTIVGPERRNGRRFLGLNSADVRYELAFRSAPPFLGTTIIQKDVSRIGVRDLEKSLDFVRGPLIFDIDDAIFLQSSKSKYLDRSSRIGTLMSRSSTVIVGNSFLAEFAGIYSENVDVIPTCVPDFTPVRSSDREGAQVVVGWLGSSSTVHYLLPIVDDLARLSKEIGFTVRFVGDLKSLRIFREYPFEFYQWSLSREAEVLRSFDIALNPLADSTWEKGKCAYKTLLYAVGGAAVIGSPVGVSGDILKHTGNLMPSSSGEWTDALRYLVRDPAARGKLSFALSKYVSRNFTFGRWRSQWLRAVGAQP